MTRMDRRMWSAIVQWPKLKRFVVLAFLLVFCACVTVDPSIDAAFLTRSVVVGGERYFYRVWLPPHYTRLRRWPVILFLHGSGERGDDNVSQLANGLPEALQEHAALYPSIVVVPQCRDGEEWYGKMETQALAALEASIDEFRGDRRRVVVTGISMGGAGAWYMGRLPHRFAAIVPVSGEVVRQPGDPFPDPPPRDLAAILDTFDPHDALAKVIAPTPVWVFHGAQDDEIPVSEARDMVAALQAQHDPVRYTEYPDAGHNAWDRAYGDPQLAAWINQQQMAR